MENPVLLDLAALRRRGVHVHKTTILRWEAEGRWPRRVKLGATSYWRADEIDAHFAAIAENRREG